MCDTHNSLHQHSVSQFHHPARVGHQSAAHCQCSYVDLSVTQHYKRKLMWVSQSAAECLIRHTVVWVHSVLSPLFSLSVFLWPEAFFFCFTLTFDHLVSHATLTQIHTVPKKSYRAVSHCKLKGVGPTWAHMHVACVLAFSFQEPSANTEWEGRHLMIQHSVYEWARLHSISKQPQFTSWKRTYDWVYMHMFSVCALMHTRVCVYIWVWNTGVERKNGDRKVEVCAVSHRSAHGVRGRRRAGRHTHGRTHTKQHRCY